MAPFIDLFDLKFRDRKIDRCALANRINGEGKLTGNKIFAGSFVRGACNARGDPQSNHAAQDDVRGARDRARAFILWIDIFGIDAQSAGTSDAVRPLLVHLRMVDADHDSAGDFRLADGPAGGAESAAGLAGKVPAKQNSGLAKIDNRRIIVA